MRWRGGHGGRRPGRARHTGEAGLFALALGCPNLRFRSGNAGAFCRRPRLARRARPARWSGDQRDRSPSGGARGIGAPKARSKFLPPGRANLMTNRGLILEGQSLLFHQSAVSPDCAAAKASQVSVTPRERLVGCTGSPSRAKARLSPELRASPSASSHCVSPPGPRVAPGSCRRTMIRRSAHDTRSKRWRKLDASAGKRI